MRRPLPAGSGGVRCTDCNATAAADGTGRPIVLHHADSCPNKPAHGQHYARPETAEVIRWREHRDRLARRLRRLAEEAALAAAEVEAVGPYEPLPNLGRVHGGVAAVDELQQILAAASAPVWNQ